jgi:hypothetical protein
MLRVKIEGYPENDHLLKRLSEYAKRRGLKLATAARLLMMEALNQDDIDRERK